MTAPSFLIRCCMYLIGAVAATLFGVFSPWSAVLAWSTAVLVDGVLSGLLWLMDRCNRY